MSCDVLSEFVSVFVCVCVFVPSAQPSHCFAAWITAINAKQSRGRRLPTASHHCRQQLSMGNWQIALLPLSLCSLYTHFSTAAYTAHLTSVVPSSLFFRLTTFSILISLFSRPLCLPLVHSFFPNERINSLIALPATRREKTDAHSQTGHVVQWAIWLLFVSLDLHCRDWDLNLDAVSLSL